MTKVCSKCGVEHPIDDFGFANRRLGYRASYCRFCHTIRCRLYRHRKGAKPRAKLYSNKPLPLGSIRVFNGCCYIKVHSHGDRNHKPWRSYERWLWEKVNGFIPKNHTIKHIDGNRLNIQLSNLALTTFGQEEVLRMKDAAYLRKKKFHISESMQHQYLTGQRLRKGFIRIRECTNCGYESKQDLRCPKCNRNSFEVYIQKKVG